MCFRHHSSSNRVEGVERADRGMDIREDRDGRDDEDDHVGGTKPLEGMFAVLLDDPVAVLRNILGRFRR